MKTLSRLTVIILLAFCFSAAGCAGKPVNFASVAEQKYDLSKGRPVHSQACGFQLFLLIPINTNGRAHQAYDALLTQAGPDSVLTDIKVQEKWFYGFVGTGYCTVMTGTAYPKLLAAQGN